MPSICLCQIQPIKHAQDDQNRKKKKIRDLKDVSK